MNVIEDSLTFDRSSLNRPNRGPVRINLTSSGRTGLLAPLARLDVIHRGRADGQKKLGELWLVNRKRGTAGDSDPRQLGVCSWLRTANVNSTAKPD